MNRIPVSMTPFATAIVALSLQATAAHAQDASTATAAVPAPAVDTPEKSKNVTVDLQTVVVTGTSAATSKMKSSVSVSSIDGERVLNNQPQNAADVLTAIPGLFVQSSGGGGNANVSVRGLPISAGGSRYLQFQEDGLPVLLFGDIAFGNPDDFIRVDQSIDRVEAVRGGSAATLTTNGPGGIVNYITKTGEDQGGSIGVTSGLGFQDQRFDFSYGGKIAPKTRFFIGGFYESGEGPRTTGNSSSIQGGQIKGNITQEFSEGYVRLNFKVLSDQQPMYMPGPVNVVNGQINTVPGIDPRKYSGYSPSIPTDSVLNTNNTYSTINFNKGMTTQSNAIGLETHLNLGNNWVLDDKFRRAKNSGQWAAWYPGSAAATAATGTTYATGPQSGQAYTGLSMTSVAFDVNVKDLGNTTNDLKLTKTFEQFAGGKLTTGAGLFLNDQNVDLVWNFNGYLTSVAAAPVLLNNASQGAVSGGFIGPGFGGCCSRDYEGSYRTVSPYAFATLSLDALTLDGSVRQDNQRASGYYNLASAPANSPANAPLTYSATNIVPIDYSLKRTEYSFGANFELNKNLAFFGRYSDGAAFNADRIMAQGPLSGSATIPINTTRQLEGGVKAHAGPLSAFVTLFDAKVSEFNYSATTQAAAASKYDAKGVEFEASYNAGGFYVNAGATYTDSQTKSSSNASLVGLPANRQPKLIYQVGPGFVSDRFDLGLNIIGIGSSKDTDTSTSATMPYVTLPSYVLVNGHVTYNFDGHASFTLGAYNLFNKLAYTEVDSASAARSVNGRTIRATIKYAF
ncbi:MAG TPA: TonB-dependent receptor [Burkholderiaceae bacterium]|jgi:outer membrane receptor protein involved in Fe transport